MDILWFYSDRRKVILVTAKGEYPFYARLDEIEKGKPVYVICQSGMRSYIACRILAGYGLEVYNFSGGFRFYKSVAYERSLTESSAACGMDK